jgi:hypothetical protein
MLYEWYFLVVLSYYDHRDLFGVEHSHLDSFLQSKKTTRTPLKSTYGQLNIMYNCDKYGQDVLSQLERDFLCPYTVCIQAGQGKFTD